MSVHKKREVYDMLVERLIDATYAFGQRIAVKELAAELGVSRQPIMTALGRLDADGFVRIVPQVGCQVVDPGREAIADFYLMFSRMEGLLTELAATRRTEGQMADLRERQARILAIPADDAAGRRYAGLNRDFHQVIHTMAASPLIDEKQRANFNMSDFFINQTVGFDAIVGDAAAEHEPIIDAIENGAARSARALAEAHIGNVAGAVLAAFGSKARDADKAS